MKRLIVLLSLFLAACGTPPARITSDSPNQAVPTRVGPVSAYPIDRLTPGVYNPAVTQETIARTICRPGWVQSVLLEPAAVERIKIRQVAEYGYTNTNANDFGTDYVIPVELGGDPVDPRNMWPQTYLPTPGRAEKALTDAYLNRQVCSGAMPLGEAVSVVRVDWVAVYRLMR